MVDQDIWLTPEQAAILGGRSMIAVRALIEATLEQEGTRHLLQVFEQHDGNYESGYLLHRSLVTSQGLPEVQQSDIVERLSARVQELETEVEVLRFRAATVRQDPSTAFPRIEQVAPPVVAPIVAPIIKEVRSPQSGSGSSSSFWIVLGVIILLTIVIVLIILFKQGFIRPPQQS